MFFRFKKGYSPATDSVPFSARCSSASLIGQRQSGNLSANGRAAFVWRPLSFRRRRRQATEMGVASAVAGLCQPANALAFVSSQPADARTLERERARERDNGKRKERPTLTHVETRQRERNEGNRKREKSREDERRERSFTPLCCSLFWRANHLRPATTPSTSARRRKKAREPAKYEKKKSRRKEQGKKKEESTRAREREERGGETCVCRFCSFVVRRRNLQARQSRAKGKKETHTHTRTRTRTRTRTSTNARARTKQTDRNSKFHQS